MVKEDVYTKLEERLSVIVDWTIFSSKPLKKACVTHSVCAAKSAELFVCDFFLDRRYDQVRCERPQDEQHGGLRGSVRPPGLLFDRLL